MRGKAPPARENFVHVPASLPCPCPAAPLGRADGRTLNPPLRIRWGGNFYEARRQP